MKKKIEAYLMLDVQKPDPQLCYGTEDKRKGLTKEKKVVPCTIIYDTKDVT